MRSVTKYAVTLIIAGVVAVAGKWNIDRATDEHRNASQGTASPATAQEIVITYKKNTPDEVRERVRNAVSLDLVREADTPFVKMDVVTLKDAEDRSVDQAIRELAANSAVKSAQLQYTYRPPEPQ